MPTGSWTWKWPGRPSKLRPARRPDHEMFLLADDLPRRTKQVTVYAVDSVGKYCGLPLGATGEYEIQLGKDHVELLEQLRREQPPMPKAGNTCG